MQTTSEFTRNSPANIKLSRLQCFFSIHFEQVFYESKNVAAKKLCVGVVALKIPRKLSCDSWFCNVVGCKTQILIELGCRPGRSTWKVWGEQSCKSKLIKVTN